MKTGRDAAAEIKWGNTIILSSCGSGNNSMTSFYVERTCKDEKNSRATREVTFPFDAVIHRPRDLESLCSQEDQRPLIGKRLLINRLVMISSIML